jgi:chromosome partitioning protein
MRVFPVAMQKGGVGKSTVTSNLAIILADRGSRVLVIDADPQGHQAANFGIKVPADTMTTTDVLLDRVPIRKAIVVVRPDVAKQGNIVKAALPLHLVPSNIHLAVADAQLSGKPDGHHRLREALADVREDYDFVFIDCPPNLGMLTTNALVAAERPIVPFQTEQLSYESFPQFLETFMRVRKYLHPDLGDPILLPNMYQAQTVHHRDVLAEATKNPFGFLVFEPIRRAIKASEAVGLGRTIYEHDRVASDGFERAAERIAAL